MITKELERAGFPVVQITNLTKIAEGIGSDRILQGNSVVHVLGNPSLTENGEFNYRKDMVEKALNMLTEVPEEGKSLVEV